MPIPRVPAATALLAFALLPAAYAATLSPPRAPFAVCRATEPAAAFGRMPLPTPLAPPPAPGPAPSRPGTISAAQAVPPFAMFLFDLFAPSEGSELPSGAAPR